MKRFRRALGVAVPVAFFSAVGAWVWTADTVQGPTDVDRAIIEPNLVSKVPADARRIGARLGGKVELVAAVQESDVAMVGEETTVTLYWRCIARVPSGHEVFSHLEGPGGFRRNLDHDPVYGLYPLGAWNPGDLVRDEVWIAFPPEAGPGEYALWVGVFLDESPYPRLAVENTADVPDDGGNRVRAARWRVR